MHMDYVTDYRYIHLIYKIYLQYFIDINFSTVLTSGYQNATIENIYTHSQLHTFGIY